jgi:cellulose synthase/poly-beta-1,6-N-acetylglucosamine synthase-like glycosyltransferase
MDALEKGLLAVAAIYTGYLLLLSVAALVGRRKASGPRPPRHRFAILVPAHDEETVLPRLLDGLDGLDYPAELREMVVIADNCRDATAAIGRARGVRVLERTDPRRGKGHALSWALRQLMDEGHHDAFVILDADSVLMPDLLTHLDAALQDGALAAQAYCTVGNAEMSWRTALMAGDLALVHYLRPLGRRTLGLSAGLQGNGMCLTRRVLETVPWEAVSITEDQEYHLRLVSSGIKVHFVPDATVPTIMQATMRAARAQELRWEGGRFRLARRHVGRLLGAAWRRPSWSMSGMCLETALDLTTPPFAILVLFTAGWIALDTLRWAVGGAGSTLVPWTVLLCAQISYVLIGCALAGVPARTYAALALYGPVYALAKVWYCTQIAFGVSHEWIPTARRSV